MITYVIQSYFFIDFNFKYRMFAFLLKNKLLLCYHTFPLLTYRCLNNSWENTVMCIATDKKLLY